MLKSYLTIALRNLWRHKLYTFINILGLGIGMATMVWAYQNYRFSFSFDQIHKGKDRIFRVNVSREGSPVMRGICPLPVATSAQADFPGIEQTVRLERSSISVRAGDKDPIYEPVHFTDPAFFDVFDFPLLAGEPDITDRTGILLTAEMANKYFGLKEGEYDQAIGKTLTLYSGETHQKDFKVKGVLANNPRNSSIWFLFFTHIDNLITFKGEPLKDDDWTYFSDVIFFKLKNPQDAPVIAEGLNKYLGPQNAAREDWKVTGFELEPLTQVANHDNDLWNNALNNRPPDSATYGPIVLAVLIFLLCCLNFTNTTVALSNRRLKEMGVRKVMGGTQRQLVLQMLMESGFIVVMGVFIAYLINEQWFPAYNQMWGNLALEANYFSDPPLLGFLAILILLTTLLAGGYPAFYISRFNPANIFSGSVKLGGSNLFSRILLGLQVAISLMTVISSVAFYRNSDFQKNFDYGYELKEILFTLTRDRADLKGFKDAVDRLPNVAKTAATIHHMGFSWWFRTMESQVQRKEAGFMQVGPNYLETLELEVIDGRGFDPGLQSDFNNALLVNEKLVAHFGWNREDVIGRRIRIDTFNYSVVGLLKDFHVNDLYNSIEPIALKLSQPEKCDKLVVHTTPGKAKQVMEQMKITWNRLYPYKPFEGYYQNDMIADAQNTTDNVAWIFSLFAVVSVLLTAVGLFALISQTVAKKMKEIAVRKVVGASAGHIMYLVNKGFIWIFLIAGILGGYGGWYLTQLLMDMIFRINVGVGTVTLGLSFTAVFVIAFTTVGIRIRQALRTNPADVLRSD